MINKQRHRTSCGPTATCNALRWLGIKASYDEVVDWYEKYTPYNKYGIDGKVKGLFHKDLGRALRMLGVSFRKIENITLKQIQAEIDKGNAVIYQYKWVVDGEYSGHFNFIDKYTKCYVRAWNDSRYNKTPWKTKKDLAKWIRYNNRHRIGNGIGFIILNKK